MIIEQIESEEKVEVVYDAETGRVKVRGADDAAIDKALARIRENKVEATKELRLRLGLPAFIEREEPLNWSRDGQVAKQRGFMMQHGEYHQWSEDQLTALGTFLQPGDEIMPTYAFSLYIKRADGSLVHYEKTGKLLEG